MSTTNNIEGQGPNEMKFGYQLKTPFNKDETNKVRHRLQRFLREEIDINCYKE